MFGYNLSTIIIILLIGFVFFKIYKAYMRSASRGKLAKGEKAVYPISHKYEKNVQDLKSPLSKIVFERSGDNIGIPLGIFTINPEGSDLRQIMSSSSGAAAPEWSTDGKWIAFYAAPKGELFIVNIFIMRPNGKEVRQVTNYQDCSAACPTWSPDSKKIAYCITKDAKNQVGVVDIESLQCKQITFEESNGYPVWTPWGDIVFFKNHNKIYIMDSDGRNQREYDIFQEGDQEPVWSRDGKQIVFTRQGRICVMNADGSNLRTLPVKLGNLVEVSWSPDGQQIGFTGQLNMDSPRNVYTVDNSGLNLKCIVENHWIKDKGKEVISNDLCWSPWL